MAADLAIDLGTATTLAWSRGGGVVLREPTVVAVDPRGGKVHAAGRQAFEAVRASEGALVIERPLSGGAVTDFTMTARMLRLLFERLGVTRFSRARVLLGVPAGCTNVERQALQDAARQAGAGRAYLLDEPLAAAIGADLPVHDAVASMVVDCGGGNTEAAVVSLGGVVTSQTVRVGGYDLDVALQDWVRTAHGIAIGDRTAEELKIAIGSAFPQPTAEHAEVRGRDLESGTTRTVTVEADEVRTAIERPVTAIVGTVLDALSECPPELAHDLMEKGMLLVGGGALLRGLDQRISAEAQVAVTVADHPLDAVVRGLGSALEVTERLAEVYGA